MTSNTPAYRYRTPDRAELAAGLRELADFLTAHPEVPTPHAPTLMVFNHSATDAERCDFIRRSALALDAEVIDQRDHFTAVRMFGPIAYQLWVSTLAGEADYQARTSYNRSVRP